MTESGGMDGRRRQKQHGRPIVAPTLLPYVINITRVWLEQVALVAHAHAHAHRAAVFLSSWHIFQAAYTPECTAVLIHTQTHTHTYTHTGSTLRPTWRPKHTSAHQVTNIHTYILVSYYFMNLAHTRSSALSQPSSSLKWTLGHLCKTLLMLYKTDAHAHTHIRSQECYDGIFMTHDVKTPILFACVFPPPKRPVSM